MRVKICLELLSELTLRLNPVTASIPSSKYFFMVLVTVADIHHLILQTAHWSIFFRGIHLG